ncbi:MAG TPA: type IV pili methyl-accepting chemotaxis transducer N-terminal domain-containing protein [Burkholderiaceae bacterium]|nr:type IV pili methyl-accepting chemotaxis transducer N-terminal domain-containing protein [Burkholderiaceae bacterium]
MTTVLLIQSPDPDAPALAPDLAAAGFTVLAGIERLHLVRDALRSNPDVVLCWEPRPDDSLLQAIRTLQAQQPLPVLVFTQDADVVLMGKALDAGVHAWVVQGYAPQRLRPLVHLAQARQAHEQALRASLSELSDKFEERKLVDKAKGILMRARQVSEDEAFRLLRTASMHGNQRVGQVSRQVIDAAQVAEAINRAGQQRMLSLRMVKLYALVCSKADAAAAGVLLKQSIARVEENMAMLQKSLSEPTFGDLLAAGRTCWEALKRLLEGAPSPKRLTELDALSDAMVAQADALATALETSGLATTVQVINVSGRQRMLSQRMAKQALLAAAGAGPVDAAAAMAQTAQAFEQGMATLAKAPLSTAEIREALASAQDAWTSLLGAVPRANEPAGRLQIASASETLLELFDRLTQAYQHSMQVLMG